LGIRLRFGAGGGGEAHMWFLRTFGGLSIDSGGGAAVPAVRRRPLAVLALLAIAGERGMSREKVVALLWPESDEERGRNSLSQALAGLRRDTSAEDLVVGTTDIRLNSSAINSDVGEFERSVESGALERAVGLYQGPFLDGVFVREAADFEQWADGHRRRLHDMCTTSLERLARAADKGGDSVAALAWWRRLATVEPTSARAVSGLMRALAASGDRAGAQRQYRVYEELLKQELGVAPEAEVAALAAALFTEQANAAVPVVTAAVRPHESASPQPQVGADAAEVRDAIATPTGRTIVVVAGVGRRSLVRRAALPIGLMAMAALSAVGVIAMRRDRVAALSAAAASRRVVVRTFKNNSGDKALDPIGAMAADWIARGLTETPSVDVAGTEADIASRDSAGRSAAAMTPSELGRLMRARYVISGSYTTQGDSLFLQSEVTDVDAGRRVLAIEPVGDVILAKMTALERLRHRVTGALVPFFDSSIVTESRVPPRYEAYQAYLLADQSFLSNSLAPITHLREAVRLDSTFVVAWIRLISAMQISTVLPNPFLARDSVIAKVETMRNEMSPYEAAAFDFRVAIARRRFHDAYVAADNARRLAPKSSWAVYEAAETALMDGRPHETARLLEGIDPAGGVIRWYSYHLSLCRAYHALNRGNDMRRCIEQARSQRPGLWLREAGMEGDADRVERLVDSIGAPTNLVAALFELEAHGRGNRAHAIAERALARMRQPTDSAHAAGFLDARMGVLVFLGEWNELVRVADSTLQHGPSRWAFVFRGVASAMLGDSADARRRVDTLIATTTRDGTMTDAARILAALGDKKSALAQLQLAAAPAFQWQYHGDLIYRLMRGYAPFEDFLRPRD
jgi:DNA-binding SARP family transcriptional activator/TolB-like protein